MNMRGHKFGIHAELGVLIVCALHHALSCRGNHPDSKRQRKARMRDLTIYRMRQIKQAAQ